MLIIEDNKIKEIEPFEPIDMPQSWTLDDALPYQAMCRYRMENGEVNLMQIYIKKNERRKGLAAKIFKYLEKKGKIKMMIAPPLEKNFGEFIKKMGYKKRECINGDYYWFRKKR